MPAVSAGLSTTDLSSGLSPQYLAESLLGGGLSISSVEFTGPQIAAGTFSGGTDIIGFEEGILLSSGNIANVIGPNMYDGITSDNYYPGDLDLNTLIPGYFTNDATILEFDFVPENDILSFEYVFASDEYNEWVGSSYNDVFGFFVNGENIALLPDGVTPVSINNVNSGSNPEYYRNNDLSDGGGAIDTEMDGLTVVLTAVAAVQPGQINHIKLAIADAGDSALDSNVFLRAQSFLSFNPVLEPESATLFVGETHNITAKLYNSIGQVNPGQTVYFEVIDGPHAGTGDYVVTDADGIALWNYSGTLAGTDTIIATWGGSESNPVYATWESHGYVFILEPGVATNHVGHTHTLTANIQDDLGEPLPDMEILFTILSGPHAGTTGINSTDQNGNATFSYTGSSEGIDDIKASFIDTFGYTIYSNEVTSEWLPSNADIGLITNVPQDDFYIGHSVPWVVRVTNYGPDDASNIVVKEDISGLHDLENISYDDPDSGYVDVSTHTWTIPSLPNGNSTSLTFNTTFNASGIKINQISVIELDQSDLVYSNNSASMEIVIQDIPEGSILLTISDPQSLSVKGDLHDPASEYDQNPFEINASVENLGTFTVYDINVTILLSEGLSLVDDDPATQGVGTLEPGDTVTVRWNVSADRQDSDQNLTYEIVITCSGVPIQSLEGKIFVPEIMCEPTARFNVTTASGEIPFFVQFYDFSRGIPTSWAWDFGDGSPISYLQNPNHTYENPGSYIVNLTVSNVFGTDSESIFGTDFGEEFSGITVTLPPPVANFSADRTIGVPPSLITFIDLSEGQNISYLWDFGDGQSDAVSDPEHTYTEPGRYDVSLTAINSGGESTIEKEEFITIYSAFYTIDFDIPGIEVISDGSQYVQGKIGPGIEWDGSVLNVSGLEGGIQQAVYYLDDASEGDGYVYGRLLNATMVTQDLEARLMDDSEISTKIEMYLTRIPVGNFTVGILDGAGKDALAGFEGAAGSEGRTVPSLLYSLDIRAGILDDCLSSARFIFSTPETWADEYGEENIRLFRYDDEGITTILMTSYCDEFSTFTAYSPGFSTFGAGSLDPSASPVIPTPGSHSGHSSSSKSTVTDQSVPETPAEPPVIGPELITDISGPLPGLEPTSQEFVPGETGSSPADADQLFTASLSEFFDMRTLVSTDNPISSQIRDGEYMGALKTSLDVATDTRFSSNPVQSAIPENLAPICALATGIGLTAFGAAFSGHSGVLQPPGTQNVETVGRSPLFGITRIGLGGRTGLGRFGTSDSRFAKFINTLKKFIFFKLFNIVGSMESKIRKLIPRDHDAYLLGFSRRELLVAGLSAVLFSVAFVLAGRLNVQVLDVGLFLVMGAVAIIGHDMVTDHVAKQNGCRAEFQMWGFGSGVLISTAGLFGLVFGKPARTVIEGLHVHEKKFIGSLMLIGPLVNVIFALLSLFLIPLGGILGAAGAVGFPVNLLLAVYTLVPIRPLKGEVVFRWNKLVWAVFFFPLIALFLFVYLI